MKPGKMGEAALRRAMAQSWRSFWFGLMVTIGAVAGAVYNVSDQQMMLVCLAIAALGLANVGRGWLGVRKLQEELDRRSAG